VISNDIPLISVIIPVYNVEHYLARCLDSVLSQSHSNLEVLIVDDGSTDGSGAVCEEYSKRDDRVRTFCITNAGVSAARNAGLDAARGDWVAFIDSDDWIEPDMLEKLLRAAMESGAQLAASGYVKYYPEGKSEKVTCPELAGVVTSTDILEYHVFVNDFIRVWSILYSRNLLEPGGGAKMRFRTELFQCEDTTFVVEVMLLAGSFVYVPEAPYHYCWREDSLVNTSFNPRRVSVVDAWAHIAKILEPFSCRLVWRARIQAAEIAVDLIVVSIRSGYFDFLPKLKKAARRHSVYYLLRSGGSPAKKLRHLLYTFFPKSTNRIYCSLRTRMKPPKENAKK